MYVLYILTNPRFNSNSITFYSSRFSAKRYLNFYVRGTPPRGGRNVRRIRTEICSRCVHGLTQTGDRDNILSSASTQSIYTTTRLSLPGSISAI